MTIHAGQTRSGKWLGFVIMCSVLLSGKIIRPGVDVSSSYLANELMYQNVLNMLNKARVQDDRLADQYYK